jgi:uncharacterized integral membrane protein
MRLVLVIIVLAFVILAVFTVANWQVLTMATPLSFVLFSIEGPLGVILLGVSLALTLLVVAYALILRTSWLMESRRLNRQLEEQRELADRAESSRVFELQELVKAEFRGLRTHLMEIGDVGIARIDTAEQSLSKVIENASNSVMAHIGYLDDSLKGGSGSGQADTETGSR